MLCRILEGNIWDYHKQGRVVAITTNGSVKKDGSAVLGCGIAKQAKELYPDLPRKLGEHIQHKKTELFLYETPDKKVIICMPVKKEWYEVADLRLIKFSLRAMRSLPIDHIYLPRPGCGAGNLHWPTVRNEIMPILLNSNLYIVDTKIQEVYL